MLAYYLFILKWKFKNRRWKNCRQKEKAFEKALAKFEKGGAE